MTNRKPRPRSRSLPGPTGTSVITPRRALSSSPRIAQRPADNANDANDANDATSSSGSPLPVSRATSPTVSPTDSPPTSPRNLPQLTRRRSTEIDDWNDDDWNDNKITTDGGSVDEDDLDRLMFEMGGGSTTTDRPETGDLDDGSDSDETGPVRNFPADCIVHYLADDGGPVLSGPERDETVRSILTLHKPPKKPTQIVLTDRIVRITELMRVDVVKLDKLEITLSLNAFPTITGDFFKLPVPQCVAVCDCLLTYPNLLPNLQSCVTAVKFNMGAADPYGGGVFDNYGDNRIQMSDLVKVPPRAFVRLLVHEMGHATFERIIMGNKKMALSLDKLTTTVDGFALAQSDRLSSVDQLPPDAQLFYRAWLTLRADNGAHLLGLDLGQSPNGYLSPAVRRTYQADSFAEFCAETFMLFAMGELTDHVDSIMAMDGLDAVKSAWVTTLTILRKLALPILTEDCTAQLGRLMK